MELSSSKDVTGVFDHYRTSVRSIWNAAFWPDPDFRNWDSLDGWFEIARILFDELVLRKLNKRFPVEDLFRRPIPFFSVAPAASTVPILIARPTPEVPKGLWDDPVNRVASGDAALHFLAFFDWNQLDYRDLQYYHVSIAAFDKHPHLIGREALIERQYVPVFLVEQVSGLPG